MIGPSTTASQLRDFLSRLASIKGDLSNITAPPSLLSPTSITEMPASWVCRHELFLRPADEPEPAKRALLVLENFLCSLKHQVRAASDETTGAPRKPLNPFLGEVFVGTVGGSTRVVAEQVSHHPPVTACAAYNAETGISSSGYVACGTTLDAVRGRVLIRQTGHATVRDARNGESHLRTLPTMVVRGLFSSSFSGRPPRLGLEGTCYVVSSSGYLSTIEFLTDSSSPITWWGSGGKSVGGGGPDGVRAELRCIREGDKNEGQILYVIEGQWSGRLKVTECATGQIIEDFHVDDIPETDISVRPLDEQSPWESRRAWRGVAEGIRSGDMERVRVEKTRIEEAQRQMRAAERRARVVWPTLFFRQASASPEFALLARAIPGEGESGRLARELALDKTAGAWDFVGPDVAEALVAGGVYHSELEPMGQVASSL